MNMRLSSAVLLAFALSASLFAQSSSPMREGMWEVTMKMNLPGMGDSPPMTQRQCITAANIRDPQSTMPKMDNDCKISNYKLEGNKATYTMTCTQPTDVTAIGEIKYAGSDAYTGTLTLSGGAMNVTLNYDAKRTGDCPK